MCFANKLEKPTILFEICHGNTTAGTETLTEKQLQHNFALHFTSYLSIALSKILSFSKTIKNAQKLLVFGESDSHCLSDFLQAHIFSNFGHISRIYHQVNYREFGLENIIIILIMTAQLLFFNVFLLKKTNTLMLLSDFLWPFFLYILQIIFGKSYLDLTYCTIVDSSVFDKCVLADVLFAEALWSLKTCVSVIDNSCGELESSCESLTTFDERFEVASVPYCFLISIYWDAM